jgi:hypothetical protein
LLAEASDLAKRAPEIAAAMVNKAAAQKSPT